MTARPSSTELKSFLIRDPIHSYVRVAPHERVIIDHSITQRLRRVTQTGLAEYVYPEARTSRFGHSLGAMHLASRFLIACVEHATEETVDKFLAGIRERLATLQVIDLQELDILLLSPESGSSSGLMAGRAVLPRRADVAAERDDRRLLALAEAGLRLAALFHDLGHLPFSHDFEVALWFAAQRHTKDSDGSWHDLLKFIKSPPLIPPHEKIGHAVARVVLKTLLLGAPPGIRASYALAREILEEPTRRKRHSVVRLTAVGWLHSLVDGEVDVDRADYLLRDGRALGFEFAAYDLRRLVDNLNLHWTNDQGFSTVVGEHGLSALETFMIARARSNEYLVRHHKVGQLAAAFVYASAQALQGEGGQALVAALARLAAVVDKEGADRASRDESMDVLQTLSSFDDGWWLGVLRKVRPGADVLLEASLGLVLHRKRTLVTAWKRRGDMGVTSAELKKINALVADEGRWGSIRRQLEKNRMLVRVYGFTPYRTVGAGRHPNESTLSVLTANGLVPVSRRSELICAIATAWLKDIHLHVFSADDVSAIEAKTQALRLLTESHTSCKQRPPKPTRQQSGRRKMR